MGGGLHSPAMDDAWLVDGPKRAKRTVVLAHGAGAAMDTPFMNFFAEGLAARGLQVVRFEFPYMAKRRTTGTRGGPDRAPVLMQTWRDVVAALGEPGRIVIGGKSMGGRYATMMADELGVGGVFALGYPFHAPGRPDKPRVDHLKTLKTPCLIAQGTRDSMGNEEEVPGYGLPGRIRVHWLGDGDHSLKPRKKSGRTLEQNLGEALEVLEAFVAGV